MTAHTQHTSPTRNEAWHTNITA